MRRGIFDHVHSGALNMNEFIVLQLLIAQADSSTGSGTINAVVLRHCYFPELTTVTAQRTLCNLERKGYLFRLNPAASKRAYRYWINKYEATVGPNRMRRIDLSQVFLSKDIKALRWVDCAPQMPRDAEAEAGADVSVDVSVEMSAEVSAEVSNSYKKKERRKKQTPSSSVSKTVVKEKSLPAVPHKIPLTTSSSATPSPKKPPRARPKSLPPDERLLIIFQAYPRQAVVGRALAALKVAVGTISARDHCTRDEACDWLQTCVAAYAAKKAGTDPQYIPYLSTWLKDQGYDDAALVPKPKTVWEECSWEDCKTPEYQAMVAKCSAENGWGQL